jgi:hypothetical protein
MATYNPHSATSCTTKYLRDSGRKWCRNTSLMNACRGRLSATISNCDFIPELRPGMMHGCLCNSKQKQAQQYASSRKGTVVLMVTVLWPIRTLPQQLRKKLSWTESSIPHTHHNNKELIITPDRTIKYRALLHEERSISSNLA